MNTGKLFISDYIGVFTNEDNQLYNGVQLVDVVSQVRALGEVDAYEVIINSGGGVVDTGNDIFHYLKSLNKPIKTVAKGTCASIATVIFMAGTERVIMPNCQFMVHNPSGGVQGTADDIELYSKEIKRIQNELIDFYSKELNTTKEAIAPILRDETFLTPDQAVQIGFATSIGVELGVVAKFNTETDMSTKTNELSKEDKNWFEQKLDALFNKHQKPVAKLVADANGVEINFTELEEDAEPKVGDVATIEGQPANGEHVMPDGRTLVFVDGAVTEIVEADDDMSEEMEALKKENDELKEQIATAKAEKDAAKAEEDKINAAFDELFQDFKNFKSDVSSRFDVVVAKTKDETTVELSPAQARLKKIKENKQR